MKLYLLLSLLTVTLHTTKTIRNIQGKPVKQEYVCTGVFISPNQVLTAGHCLENAEGITLVTSQGLKYPAFNPVLASNADLGLLRTTTPETTRFIPLLGIAYPTEHVYTLGSGEDYVGTYGEGIVQNVISVEENAAPMIMHSIAIKHGSSGSGLFDAEGNLVGINTLSDGAFSWAVNTKEIREFLKHAFKTDKTR